MRCLVLHGWTGGLVLYMAIRNIYMQEPIKSFVSHWRRRNVVFIRPIGSLVLHKPRRSLITQPIGNLVFPKVIGELIFKLTTIKLCFKRANRKPYFTLTNWKPSFKQANLKAHFVRRLCKAWGQFPVVMGGLAPTNAAFSKLMCDELQFITHKPIVQYAIHDTIAVQAAASFVGRHSCWLALLKLPC